MLLYPRPPSFHDTHCLSFGCQASWIIVNFPLIWSKTLSAQLFWAVEYTDCFPAPVGKTLSLNKCSGYETKESEGEALILEIWRMLGTSSLPLLQFIGQIEICNHFQNLKPFSRVMLKKIPSESNIWKHLTVCKQMSSGSFKKLLPINHSFTI